MPEVRAEHISTTMREGLGMGTELDCLEHWDLRSCMEFLLRMIV